MSQPAFDNIDSLLDANMDDLESLPPMGVPPTGNYVLDVTASRETSADKKSEYFKFAYEVVEVGELKNDAEASEAAVGMKFNEMFSPFKKDGTVNEVGIGFLKERVAPFSAHFGTTKIGDTLQELQGVRINATLSRRADKREEGRYNFSLKDVIIL